MDHFVGRKAELTYLENAYKDQAGQFIPIYGRRRVGKSELILQFIRGKPAIYFLGKESPRYLQIRAFLDNAAHALRQPLLGSLTTDNWQDAIKAVTSQHDGKGKLILVFDEFQWTAKSCPELPSVIQEFWDQDWQKGGNIMLILCGSYLGFMEKKVLGRKSPLFGRRTGQIRLQPFSYVEAAEFHPRWSWEDKARAYFICGGIPFYLKLFTPQDSISQSIQKQFLNEFGVLFREADFLLREELRELERYHGILMVLSSGTSTTPEIAAQTGINEQKLFYYLQSLSALGYIERQYPLTGKKPSSRQVRFMLSDPMLRFWFRFIYPNQDYIARQSPAQTHAELIRPQINGYFGKCFETFCGQALLSIYLCENIPGPFQIGAYWNKDVQIDLVGIRADNRIDICECKWGPVRSIGKLVDELQRKIACYPNPHNATIQPRIFARKINPRARIPDNVICHQFPELYKV